MGATWRLLASLASKPRKQPLVAVVVVMFFGTSERMTWPLTFRVESDRVKVKGELGQGLTCLVGVMMLLVLFLIEFRVGFGGDIVLKLGLLIEKNEMMCV